MQGTDHDRNACRCRACDTEALVNALAPVIERAVEKALAKQQAATYLIPWNPVVTTKRSCTVCGLWDCQGVHVHYTSGNVATQDATAGH